MTPSTDSPVRLGIFSTHPIQYLVPWYRALTAVPGLQVTVYYASLEGANTSLDREFGMSFAWDIPLLDGYRWERVENHSPRPSVNTLFGTDTPGIQDTIRRGKFDAFIIPGWGRLCYLQAAQVCFDLGVPLMIRGEALANDNDPWIKRVVKHRVISRLLSRCAACLCIGKRNEQFYRSLGVAANRLFSANYCVDNEFFATRAAAAINDRVRLRREWKLPEHALVFLFAGKFVPIKRPMDLMKAVRRMTNDVGSRQEFAVLCVGDGPLRSGCEEYARNHRLPISFVGFLNQTEMPKAYCAADCLILPSRRETWGIVVNEAMACGRPAIVSDTVGCAPDLVTSGETGFVYRMSDFDSLAARMKRFFFDNNLSKKMGEKARLRVAQYTLDRAVAGTLEAIRCICNR